MVSQVHSQGAVPRLQPDSVPLHRPDLPAPHRSHSACPLRAWHWYDREHGCAGCCILMYDSAERGTRFAERHLVSLYPCRTSRRRGILHRTLFRSLCGGSSDARALCFELHSTRACLYRALTLLAPFVSVGSVKHDATYPMRTHVPSRVAWPEIGGIIPPRHPLLPPNAGPRPHPCSNG